MSRIIPQILKEEKQHIAHGIQILTGLCQTDEGKAAAQKSLDHMYPRCLDMFGVTGSKRSGQYLEWGIKKRTNDQGRTQYREEVTQIMSRLGLKEPDPLKDRRFL